MTSFPFLLRLNRGPMEGQQDDEGITWAYRVPLEGARDVDRAYSPPGADAERVAACTERMVLVVGGGLVTGAGRLFRRA